MSHQSRSVVSLAIAPANAAAQWRRRNEPCRATEPNVSRPAPRIWNWRIRTSRALSGSSRSRGRIAATPSTQQTRPRGRRHPPFVDRGGHSSSALPRRSPLPTSWSSEVRSDVGQKRALGNVEVVAAAGRHSAAVQPRSRGRWQRILACCRSLRGRNDGPQGTSMSWDE